MEDTSVEPLNVGKGTMCLSFKTCRPYCTDTGLAALSCTGTSCKGLPDREKLLNATGLAAQNQRKSCYKGPANIIHDKLRPGRMRLLLRLLTTDQQLPVSCSLASRPDASRSVAL